MSLSSMMLPLLVVDDDGLMLSMLTDILEPCYPVIPMNSALQAAEINPDTLGGLLTDWHMTKLNGLELVRRLRAKRPHLPVVIVSGSIPDISTLSRQFSLDSGWENIRLVTKPFAVHVLLETVREVMGKQTMRHND